MTAAFPPGAPSFQLPRPLLGVVYLEDGWVVVKLDRQLAVRVYQVEVPDPLRYRPCEISGDD